MKKRRWLRAVRTLALSTAIGALVGAIAGAEHEDQRFIILGLAAAVGLVTGVFLLLIPPRRQASGDRDGNPEV